MPSIPIEICADAVGDALDAWRAGAHRIEYCADLSCGGTTPDPGQLARLCAEVAIPIVALVRTRAGNFTYSPREHAAMLRDVEDAKQAGAAGVAVGELTAESTIDIERVAELVAAARPMQVTCHRAFDLVADPLSELERLIEIGVDRILTSGGAAAAIDAVDALRALVEAARGRTVILVGGGVRSQHAAELLARTDAAELHSSVRIDGAFDVDEVRRLIAAANGAG